MRTPTNERLSPDIVKGRQARDSGPARPCPERRCILSGETVVRDRLVRLAISPEGDVLPDPLAKAPGRGAWIGVTRAELDAAMAKGKLCGALAHAFKGPPPSVPGDLSERIEKALVRTLLDRLGLEMRGGNLILGSDRIAEQARNGAVGLLLHALDASDGGRKKLDQAWRVGCETEGSDERGLVLPLDRAALSVALGRENVVHLALIGRGTDDGAAGRVMQILARLLHFQGVTPGDSPGDDGSEPHVGCAAETI